MTRMTNRKSPRRSGNPGARNFPPQRLIFLLGMAIPSPPSPNARLISFRKRAKTDDEKEQRRIERVLRNRQAAQSSRERKRQEVEKLEGEKTSIEQQNESLKERLMTVEHEKFLLTQQVAKLSAQMRAIQSGHELSPPPESSLFRQDLVKQELDDYTFALPTPQNSFGAPSTSFPSPSATYTESSTPATVDLSLDALTATPDLTQHPAAMLCDLQCQSVGTPQATNLLVIPSSMANLVCLTLISAVYSQLMYPLMTIFNCLKTNSELPPSMMHTPMVLPLIRWLISTPANLLPPTRTAFAPTVKKASPTTATATPPTTPSRLPVLRLRLLRRLLLSSPSLARPLRAATGRALRPKTGSVTSGTCTRDRVVRGIARRGEKAGLRGGARSKSRRGWFVDCISMRAPKDRRR